MELFKEYKFKCDNARARNSFLVYSALSIITSPLYVIGMSMQMSILPNLTIYGDVKPSEINKGLLVNRLGIDKLTNRKAIATSEKQLAIFEEKK
jgi:hypothetical protein